MIIKIDIDFPSFRLVTSMEYFKNWFTQPGRYFTARKLVKIDYLQLSLYGIDYSIESIPDFKVASNQ